jgi:hypothetical protein
MQDQPKAAFKFVENNEVSLACSALARNQTACAAGRPEAWLGPAQASDARQHQRPANNSTRPSLQHHQLCPATPARNILRDVTEPHCSARVRSWKQTYALKQFVSGN